MLLIFNRLLFTWVSILVLSACSADLDWREVSISTIDIQVKSLMPNKPQNHQTRLTNITGLPNLTTEPSSRELISRVEIKKNRGLFFLALATMPSENQTKQVLERVFFDLLTTQQQSISRQLKQTITQSEKKLLLTKPLLITAQSPAKLIQERWLIDQSAQPILAASSATLTNHNLSHISRFVLIKRDHHYWIIQQTYRGNLPLNQEELGMWFSSLTIQ